MQIKTSTTEIKQILIAWLAISVAFTIVLWRWYPQSLISIFVISAVTVGLAFILHELAHKIVAQKYGAWSEFRMEPFMLLIALVTAFMGFLFAAPGAVMIFNPYLTRKESGKIAVAGPVMNLALAVLFIPLIFTSGILKQIGEFGVMINAWLALFNMIPISVLDGRKVLAWDRTVFGIVVGIAIVMWILSMTIV
jgi:Zn-dependent protease